MRDLASCFSEHAIKVSDSSCSGSSSRTPLIQNTITCCYKTKLSTQKHLLITIIWCNNSQGHGFIIKFNDNPFSFFKIDSNSSLLHKPKGHRKLESVDCNIEVFWDLSCAKYGLGPEPFAGFFIAVIADSELGLLLGDKREEAIKKFKTTDPIAQFCLISRKELVFGKILHSTKARFSENGADHDILIQCSGEKGKLKEGELCVSIDNKEVIHVERLQWKFRGNETIFIDGLPVDMMWDVHGWFFKPGNRFGVFMFRTRGELERRLWLEEKPLDREQDSIGFSLLIYLCL